MTTTKTTPVAVWLNLHALVMDHKWLSRDLLHDRTDGMPWSGYRVLRRVEDGPLSQGRIADLMGIDAPAVSGIITDLVARGYIDRTATPRTVDASWSTSPTAAVRCWTGCVA